MNSSLPLIRIDESSVTYDPSKISEVFSIVFQNKQSDQVFNLPPTCFPNPKITYFALKLAEIKYSQKDLIFYGSLGP